MAKFRLVIGVWVLLLAATLGGVQAQSRQVLDGYCEQGGQTVTTDSRTSTTRVQRSFPNCQVTIYDSGTLNLATIYSDYNGIPRTNPFIAASDGYWQFIANSGRYDVKMEGGGIPAPFTRSGRWTGLLTTIGTPPTITANQDNYNLGGLKQTSLRLTSDAQRTITGLSIGQADGEMHWLWNGGSFNLLFTNQDAASSPANRFLNANGATITLTPGESLFVTYDTTSQRWRVTKNSALFDPGSNGYIVRTGVNTLVTRSFQPPVAGITISNPDGVTGNTSFSLSDDLAGVEGLGGTGLATRIGPSTWTTRSILAPPAGITVTNGDGVAGNIVLGLANNLAAVEGLGTNGVAVKTGAGAWTTRTISPVINQTIVTNGDGIVGNPTIGTVQDIATTSSPNFANVVVGAGGGAPVAGAVKGAAGVGTNVPGGDLELVPGTGTGIASQSSVVKRYVTMVGSGSGSQGVSANTYPVTANMCSMEPGVSFNNTTAETTLFTICNYGTSTIEAGMAEAGQTYILHISGRVNSTGTPDLTIRLKAGAVTIATLSPATLATGTSGTWRLDANLHIRFSGASGAISVNNAIAIFRNNTGAAQFQGAATATGVNLAVATDIRATMQWSAASTNNSIDVDYVRIDIVR